MTKEDIEKEIGALPLKLQVIAIAEAIGPDSNSFRLLWQIVKEDKGQLSWRAAWVVENIFSYYPWQLDGYLSEMMELLDTTRNQSIRRHLLKIFSMMETLPEEYLGRLVNICFNALQQATNPPAVKAHSMNLLFSISLREPDMREEVLMVLRDLLFTDRGAGVQARARDIILKIERLKQKEFRPEPKSCRMGRKNCS